MDTHDLMEEYYNTWNEYSDEKAKLDSLIQQWLNNELDISADEIQKTIDAKNNEIDELKSLADTYLSEYKKITEEKAKRKHAIYTVRNTFGVSPEALIITGGTLSDNKDESHLEGRVKTTEELELEKKNILNELKTKIMAKELTLAEASNIKNKIEIAYKIPGQEEQSSLKR